MRLVFAGTPEHALPTLDALVASRHDVMAVITRPDAPVGRGRKLAPSPVASRAEDAGLPVLRPTRLREPAFLEELRSIGPECCAVVAYGALIPPVALEIPKHGWVNLHFSLLPAWRGAAPVQHTILRGDDVTGATTFQIEEGLDTGPAYGVVTESLRPDDTSGSVLARLARSGADLFLRTLDGIESGELAPRPQPSEGVSLAPKLTRDDARIDWTAPALHIDRLIRACTPAPGAWTTFRDDRLKLGPVGLVPGGPELAAGQLRMDRNHVLVGTGTHPVELGDVRAQGRKQMLAADWARGARLRDDDGLR